MAERPFVIGLTGSIGMGKSQTAKLFREEGVAVHDADAAIHRLYAPGGAAVPLVQSLFPEVIESGAVNRPALAARVLGDAAALAALEKLVHPLVLRDREEFLVRVTGDIAVLDIPLLFETGSHEGLDAVVVVSAPADVQRDRVLARPGMTPEKFAALLARQMPDAQKRAQADYVVTTAQGLDHAREQVKMILADIRQKQCAK
jgi:dephospho-CoA kinase